MRRGADLRCVRRFFGGALGECELVEMESVVAIAAGQEAFAGHRDLRTARVFSDDAIPPVHALGGVCRSDMCDHIGVRGGPGPRLVANAGPNAGRRCCTLCGGYVGRLRVWMPNPCRPNAAQISEPRRASVCRPQDGPT